MAMAKKQHQRRKIVCDFDNAEKQHKLLAQEKQQCSKPLPQDTLGGTPRGSSGNRRKGTKRKNKKVPPIQKLEKQVLQYIVGQDKQVREIITAIYRSLKFKSLKTNVLIIGNSGTGKTETIKQVAKRLNLPYTIEDATKYTKEGYYGEDVEQMIYNLISNADENFERAKHGIIVIDEIDKKAGNSNEIGIDVGGAEVLKSLLKIIEGTTIKVQKESDDIWEDNEYDFDTSEIIVIFLGAFSGLEKIRDKRLNSRPFGFSSNENLLAQKQDTRFLKQDLIKYGMTEEFMGRIDTIIEMKNLTKEDLTLILKKSKLSILKKYQNELSKMGISLEFDSRLYERIAEKSLELDTGARELSNTVNRMFENVIYDILANPSKYTKCKLDLDIVSDNTKYSLS